MNATPLLSLPALRHLGDLAARLPCVVVDSREQDPLPIRRLPVIRTGLYSGDYIDIETESNRMI